MDDNKTTLEQQLAEVLKQKECGDKLLLKLEWIICALSLILLFMPIFILEFVSIESWFKVVLILFGLIPAIIGFYFATKIEQLAGCYECQHCKHKYIPKYKCVFWSMHIGRTRYMKCPECSKWSWQKKRIKK